jgi:predicted Na+-dependent transporter
MVKGPLSTLVNLAVVVFAVSSMLSVGLAYSFRQVVSPLRNAHAVIRALIANFILVPIFVFAVLAILPLDEPLKVGLLLIACAAGAPFLVKLVKAADGDVALGTSLLMLLLVVTIIYMPFIVPLMLPEAKVSAASIAKPLFWTMLLPLLVGHFLEVKFRVLAKRFQPVIAKVSNVALVVLLVTTFFANLHEIIGMFGRGAILSAILVVGGSYVIGYLLGSAVRGTRGLLGLGTGQRNIAAATVVATQGFEDPDILIMVVVTSLVTMAVLFPTAKALRKRAEKTSEYTREMCARPNRVEVYPAT